MIAPAGAPGPARTDPQDDQYDVRGQGTTDERHDKRQTGSEWIVPCLWNDAFQERKASA